MPNELGAFRYQHESNTLEARFVGAKVEDLAVINTMTMEGARTLTEADVRVFRMDMCNNQIDRHHSVFPVKELQTINKMIVGKPLMVNHEMPGGFQRGSLPKGTFFQSRVADKGAGVVAVQPDCYMLTTPPMRNFIAHIEGGVYRGTSIGFSFRNPECSICASDLRFCAHMPGERYGESARECHYIMHDVDDVFECSVVPLGSQSTEFSEARAMEAHGGGLGLHAAVMAARQVVRRPIEVNSVVSGGLQVIGGPLGPLTQPYGNIEMSTAGTTQLPTPLVLSDGQARDNGVLDKIIDVFVAETSEEEDLEQSILDLQAELAEMGGMFPDDD